eukprot:COSAG06_NODE_4379_length_4314_cov_10.994543_3_plen_93_part_00
MNTSSKEISAFHVSRSTFHVSQAVRRLDRNHDGEVDFQEFYAWYEQEMTEAKMRDRPLYAEVKEMFTGARNEKRAKTRATKNGNETETKRRF